MSKISKVSTLVGTRWLREHVQRCVDRPGKLSNCLRILETSWVEDPEVDGYKEFYKEAHIPMALYFDLNKVSYPQKGQTATYPIPDQNFFQDYVESLGVSNDTHIVAYDRFNSRPSIRTWFLFRLFGHDKISVLDGGLRKWLMDGYHVSVEEPTVERGQFKVNFRQDLLRDFKTMLQNTSTHVEQVVDARGRSSFNGSDEDGSGGHIPGAKNIPFSSLFTEDGTVKSNNELKQLFTEANIDLNKPLVSSCLTGLTACGLIMAAHLLGKNDVPLYNGSFNEWSKLADSSQIERNGKQKS